ncbi:MAG: sulfurtransferase [Bacteroidetes bacterium RIFCSPLOWO2_12_FULL_31_6]|nr:MAG: sulfurtransferase [Bacteroidetes bacterium RIFCSPLOWO2_12_FULL_31_6]
MSLLRKLFGLAPKVNCRELIANGAFLIDVRTPTEFSQGKPKGAKNIPLDKINKELSKIKKLNKPIVLCCASGMRSGQATSILKNNGIEAYNGGGWYNFK